MRKAFQASMLFGARLRRAAALTASLALASNVWAAWQVRSMTDVEVAEVHGAILQVLKDPDSARFRNEFVVITPKQTEHPTVCGEVNAKNSFGGYTGFTPYFYLGGTISIVSEQEIAARMIYPHVCTDESATKHKPRQ